VQAVPPFGEDDVLRLAGTVEQGSGHLLARTLVAAAHHRGLKLGKPAGVTEAAGRGVSGMVGRQRIVVGALTLIEELAPGQWPGCTRCMTPDLRSGPT
jgi:cation transport ATPase